MPNEGAGTGPTRWWGGLIRLHRYLGLGFSVLFVAWFLSGLVLIHKRMPRLATGDRLGALRPLAADQVTEAPSAAWSRFGSDHAPVAVRLSMILDRPGYRFLLPSGRWVARYADDGSPVGPVDSSFALAVAGQLAPHQRLRYLDRRTRPDQWTLSAPFRNLGPLHRVEVADGAGTEIYVSEATGEAVMRTRRNSRAWAYLGPVLHWFFFTPLRVRSGWWSGLVTYGALLGTVLAASGILVGLYRARSGRLSGLPISPFRGVLRWHHYAGLAFGVVTCTWIFSGMLSMSPGDWSPGHAPNAGDAERIRGGPIRLERFTAAPAGAISAWAGGGPVRELELRQIDGRPFYLAWRIDSTVAPAEWEDVDAAGYLAAEGRWPSRVRWADQLDQPELAAIPDSVLDRAAVSAMIGAPVGAAIRLDRYDHYYYHRLALGRALPVRLVKFADSAATWLYLDPRDGSLVRREVDRSRLERWLYHGLHSLDFPGLYSRPAVWELVMVVGSLGGLMLAGSAVVAAGRRTARSLRSQRRAA